MIIPAIPQDEHNRLETLHALKILDTEAEERIDRYTRFASLIFNMPIALVTLVDEKRQWFKSRVGLSVKETERIISFCGHCILTDEPLIVSDTYQDERFHDNPLVSAKPFIRFYAGIPLTMPDGCRVGTFCIIDQSPRVFSNTSKKVLQLLGEIVEKEIASPQFQDTDELTGISNTSGFNKLASLTIKAELSSNKDIQCVLFTLSSLSEINNQHGYKTGDNALINFAKLLLKGSKDVYAIGRLSGNIFGALIPNFSTQTTISSYLLRISSLISEFNLKNNYSLIYQTQCVNLGKKRRLYMDS
ncbi:GAF domain-containing protein [Zooshikella ganghwensis]|uniref:Diguanylate cyclase n=1 Tax=Zooshikella ganghwensis TaxID=202772 RepID=A0A4P9VMP5_9GAMM|nr:GAF domain-containing protein [Zooshikella ganghwensis]RDH43657.1 diguanylate cyclase [Zooshikella ganghwensis]